MELLIFRVAPNTPISAPNDDNNSLLLKRQGASMAQATKMVYVVNLLNRKVCLQMAANLS